MISEEPYVCNVPGEFSDISGAVAVYIDEAVSIDQTKNSASVINENPCVCNVPWEYSDISDADVAYDKAVSVDETKSVIVLSSDEEILNDVTTVAIPDGSVHNTCQVLNIIFTRRLSYVNGDLVYCNTTASQEYFEFNQ